MSRLKALTVKQPWASLIASGVKDVENRSWRTSYRGFVAIHSSARLEESEMQEACDLMSGFVPRFSASLFRREHFPTGVVLGVGELVDCVDRSDSPWFVGEFGFVIRNVVGFAEPIPCRGALSFWDPPERVVAAIREQYRRAVIACERP
jgi:hypothetical protein